jgi:hypothetical protein
MAPIEFEARLAVLERSAFPFMKTGLRLFEW